MTIKSQVVEAILRNNLSCFVHKVFHTINPSIIYEHNWHIDLICDHLNAVEHGDIKRLMINIPPRALKSVCISVAWPAWLLGHDPSKRIIAASYAQNISIKHSLDTRFAIESPWYKQLFSHTKLNKKENRKGKFITTDHGMRFASSTGGSITGEGGDILILDDPHNPTQIFSKRIREKVHQWYEQTFVSRLNDKSKGAIIIVMQRLHVDDLCGYLLKKHPSQWELLQIPAVANRQITYSLNGNNYVMSEGETIHNSRDTKEYLDNLKAEIGEDNFAAQYLQDPVDNDISILSKKDIYYYEKLPSSFQYYLLSWDTAMKTNEAADYSVCSVWGILDDKFYLVNLIRKKLAYPCLKKEVIKWANTYQPKHICIEDKASGQSIIQDLRSEGYTNIEAIKPKLDKVTRFASIVPFFQSAQILIPSQSSFADILQQELILFPRAQHDDIVDSISQAINFLKIHLKQISPRIRSF